MNLKISAAVLALSLSACCNEHAIENLKKSTEPKAVVVQSIAELVNASAQGVKFGLDIDWTTQVEVNADFVSNDCVAELSSNAVLKFSWNTQDDIKIYVLDPKDTKKLWVHASGAGEERTGPWVNEYTKFLIVDRNEKSLAKIKVKKEAC